MTGGCRLVSAGLGLGLVEGICRLVGLYKTGVSVWLGGTVSFSRSTQYPSCVTVRFSTCEFELYDVWFFGVCL